MTPRSLFPALIACALLAPASARADDTALMFLASADCSQAAATAAAQTGGRVLTVSSRSQNGQVVCVVTVIVPSDDGGRPRKETLVIPQ